jgi:hypothetical protein
VAFCGIHSIIKMSNDNIRLFANLQEGLPSSFMLEIILTFAMLAIIGFSFALFLNIKYRKKYLKVN